MNIWKTIRKNMIRVLTTAKLLRTAQEWADTVNPRLPDSPNYTNIHIENRFLKGYIGELAFFKLCHERKKKIIYRVKLTGQSDDEDFTLFLKTGQKSADIKTTGSDHINKFMLNKRQHEIHPYQIYLGAKIKPDAVDIYGFTFFDDLFLKEEGFTNAGEPTYYKELQNLRKIESLLDFMEDGLPELIINRG